MGINGSDNRLREVQRTLPTRFSQPERHVHARDRPARRLPLPRRGLRGVRPANLPARRARSLREEVCRDHHAAQPHAGGTSPATAKDEIVLEFDQPVVWNDTLAGQFYLDGANATVAGGSVQGNTLTLRLTAPSKAKQITYLDSKSWSQDNLLLGANGIAALTFCDVPLIEE